MKTDLATTVITAIFGVVVAYFVCNLFISETPNSFSFTTVDSSVSTSISDPNPEIFNYKALNPTVEVYVGNCREYNENNVCIDGINQINQGIIEQTDEELEAIELESDTSSTANSSSTTTNTNRSTNTTNSTSNNATNGSTNSTNSSSNQRNP